TGRNSTPAARKSTLAGPSHGPPFGGNTFNLEHRHMQITDLLAQMGGLGPIARQLGVSEQQAASGAAALAPAILGGFKKQAQSQPAGLDGLGGLLGKLGGGGLLDDVLSPQPANVD